uniref:Uncharacterized protein n=1 Tax=Solanum tuberosum TaxID=4113 RepID=M0ZWI2_SOLTU
METDEIPVNELCMSQTLAIHCITIYNPNQISFLLNLQPIPLYIGLYYLPEFALYGTSLI